LADLTAYTKTIISTSKNQVFHSLFDTFLGKMSVTLDPDEHVEGGQNLDRITGFLGSLFLKGAGGI
jgi:hypothetical protein